MPSYQELGLNKLPQDEKPCQGPDFDLNSAQMAEQTFSDPKISRRKFLKGFATGAVGTAAVAAGLIPETNKLSKAAGPPESPTPPERKLQKQKTPSPEQIQAKKARPEEEAGDLNAAGIAMGPVTVLALGDDGGSSKAFAGKNNEGIVAWKMVAGGGLRLTPVQANEETLELTHGQALVYENTGDYNYASNGGPFIAASEKQPGVYFQICDRSPRRPGLPTKIFLQKLRLEANKISVLDEKELDMEEVSSPKSNFVSVADPETGEEKFVVCSARGREVNFFHTGEDLETKWVPFIGEGEERFIPEKMLYLGGSQIFGAGGRYVRSISTREVIWYGCRFAVFNMETGEKTSQFTEIENWGWNVLTKPQILDNGNIFIVAEGTEKNEDNGLIAGLEFDRELNLVDQFMVRNEGSFYPHLEKIGHDEFLVTWDDEATFGKISGQRIYKDKKIGQWLFYGPEFVIDDVNVRAEWGEAALGSVGGDKVISFWAGGETGRYGDRARVLRPGEYANPDPELTPTATSTNTPEPTATQTSTPTSTPIPTMTATRSPTPTETAASTPTQEPTIKPPTKTPTIIRYTLHLPEIRK